MKTGTFENWAGNITEIGVMYPFEGSEFILVIAGLVFWIIWHVRQMKSENAALDQQVKELSKEKLKSLDLDDLDV